MFILAIAIAIWLICFMALMDTVIEQLKEANRLHQELDNTLNALGTMLGEWYEDEQN